MDRVRLGRALGYGTRHAAKTVAALVEAAGAPETTVSGVSGGRQLVAETHAAQASPPPPAPRRPVRAGDVQHGLRHLKQSVWQPLAVFSGALWLRVTGLFFGLMALTVGTGAWRLHSAWHGGPSPEAARFWIFAAVAGLFAYFAVSGFVRANRRERRAKLRR